MDSENTNCDDVIHNRLKKCGFCGKELQPIGLDYLYANISEDSIEYERCNCSKSKEYWKEIDNKVYEQQKRIRIRDIINTIYKQNYIGRKLQEMNLENFYFDSSNRYVLDVVNDYINKNKDTMKPDSLIIMGKSDTGKTHLAAAIANKLIENDKTVLMERLTNLLDRIRETYENNTKSENELIEIYSNVDMLIIDDLGTERVSKWSLEKLYTIIENRNENRLPIIITTRFDKNILTKRFKEGQDEELADAVINKLYQMCYGVTLINEKRVSKSR